MRLLRTTGTLLCAAAAVPAASGCSFITGVRGTSRVTVTVSPAIIGINQQTVAIGTAYDGDTPLSGNSRYAVTYTSHNPGVATVDGARGVVTGVAYGTAYIIAENRGSRDSALVTVRPVQATQVIVAGSRTPTYRVNAPNLIGASALDSSGSRIGDRPVVYASRNTAVLTVTNLGAITPLAVGSSWIVASIDNGPGIPPKADSVLATVTPTPVVSVRVAPNNDNNLFPTVFVGQTLQFTTTLTDSLNQTVTRPVTWSVPSSAGGYLTVDAASGLARGTAPLVVDNAGNPGTTTIFAAAPVVPGVAQPQTLYGQVTVRVLAPADSVRVAGGGGSNISTLTVSSGSTTTVALTALNAQRIGLPGRQFTVTTSDPAVLSLSNSIVGDNLLITANAAGTAILTVVTRNLNDGSAQGKTSTVTVTVR